MMIVVLIHTSSIVEAGAYLPLIAAVTIVFLTLILFLFSFHLYECGAAGG